MNKDSIYSSPLGKISGFEFDERVVSVFPDMIKRSVPGYESVVAMTGILAAQSMKPNTVCYDLGCSLGASSLSVAAAMPENCKVISVDNSSAMIEQFSHLLQNQPEFASIETVLADIRDIDISNASMVVLNFTLQFVPVEERLELIEKIYSGLHENSVLLVSEKIQIENQQMDQLFIDAHHQFKKRQGYSDLEIAQKRTAIENVLIPETIDAHFERFKSAGFRQSKVWFQCLNFCSMIAIK